ncbi:hypothetical protein JTE90_027024 [Oedothorax gibbosus]|uniref:Uncharacterized protein n=1 Tax=Oedothorax gibbosus TaxID=931172 RepID=A0AAV6UTC5_9ARAC|nr:hypothetical protein JTE90_027024 [Oedothorax gibbosus]
MDIKPKLPLCRVAYKHPPSKIEHSRGAMGGSRVKKLVVLGSGGVGKSSLVMQYLEGIFTASYKPTVEDYYRHTVKMPSKEDLFI